jgi:NAD(P)-dependent dehydrogenase (short-subunit alcohol dehydrogenase family)
VNSEHGAHALPRTPSFRLDGRRALVAGASSGLGLGAAAALAGAGAEVVMAARRAGALEEALAAIRAEGGRAEALVLDISDVAATAAAVSRHGPFDVLVNSAGTARHGSCLETAPEDYDAVMAVNLRGAYFLAQAVARGLVAAGRPGSIITLSSQMGVVGGPERAVYCASKHGIEGFTKAMAIELGPHGIRVNTICPTFIRTPLAEATLARPEMAAWVRSKIKLPRLGEVPDIMGAVLYLASDAGALVTGTALLVDGGWTAD